MYSKFTDYLVSIGFQYLGRGCSRAVYGRKNIVIKIPISNSPQYGIQLQPSVDYPEHGIECNEAEDRAWHRYKNKPAKHGVRFAPCRLLSNGCLLMKKVQCLDANENDDLINEWSWLIDGQQVGLYNGTIVAYDYGADVKFLM